MGYMRTYCTAIRVPKGSIEDCLINDQAEPYQYVRFTQAGVVEYRWSGQILDSKDMVPFVGLNQGITGDTRHGLTLGVLAGRLVADEILGTANHWRELYNPKRLPLPSTLPSMLAHDAQTNRTWPRGPAAS
ncbi:MAG: hypothetical protein Q9167_007724 [Letrouitia subvulpina]